MDQHDDRVDADFVDAEEGRNARRWPTMSCLIRST